MAKAIDNKKESLRADVYYIGCEVELLPLGLFEPLMVQAATKKAMKARLSCQSLHPRGRHALVPRMNPSDSNTPVMTTRMNK